MRNKKPPHDREGERNLWLGMAMMLAIILLILWIDTFPAALP
jgi:hypothetical protein